MTTVISLGVVVNLTFAAIANISKLFPYTYKFITEVDSRIKNHIDRQLPDVFIENPESIVKITKAKTKINNLLIGYKPTISHSLSHSLIVMYGIMLLIYVTLSPGNAFFYNFIFHVNVIFAFLLIAESIRIVHILNNRRRKAFSYLIDSNNRLKPEERFVPPYFTNKRGVILLVVLFIISIGVNIVFCNNDGNQMQLIKMLNPFLVLFNLFAVLFVKVFMNGVCRFRVWNVCRALGI